MLWCAAIFIYKRIRPTRHAKRRSIRNHDVRDLAGIPGHVQKLAIIVAGAFIAVMPAMAQTASPGPEPPPASAAPPPAGVAPPPASAAPPPAPGMIVPGFWDPRRRPERPDLSRITLIRFLTENDYPPFNYAGA